MSAVILRNEIVHYEVLGRGRPLIFLHDWVGSWRYWIPTMQAASISFRTYALDLWGFGDTAKIINYYSIEQQIVLLDEFLNEMGIGKIALIGHGLGAIISLLYTFRNPRSVDRLMAVSFPYHENALNPRMRSATLSELADWLLGHTPATEVAWVEAPKADQQAVSISLSTLQDIDLPGLPFKLTTPCLLVHGLNDPAVEPPPVELVSGLPEHAHQILFEGSGHYPMLDEPSKFNRLLTDFLNLSSGESPRQLQLKEEWKRRVR